MPHIDEGTLHALLDGALRALEPEQADAVEAHLEACAECRARAEEAATLRGRTDGVLGVLEPAVAPDFDEVLVRAGAGESGGGARARPDLQRQRHWTRGLAWAATLVIALGTGYLIRDLVPPDGATTAEMQRAPAEAGDGTAGSAATDQPMADGADSRAGEEEDMMPEAVAPSAGSGRIAAQVEEPAPTGRTTDDPAPGDLTDRDRLRAADQPDPSPFVDRPAVAAEMAMEAEEETGPELESVAPEDVLELMGAPLMVLPGAEIISTQVNRGRGGRLVVSTQRLQEGLEIRVTQQPVAIALESIVVTGVAEADAPPRARSMTRESTEKESLPLGRPAPQALRLAPAADAESGNRVTVPGGWLGWEMVLEGPLPREALEALAAAARPYEPDAR